MKDFLRSLLVPPQTAKPVAKRAASAAKPPRQPKPAEPTPAPVLESLDQRQAAMILRDMMRAKLKDPDYAKRFAAALRHMLRDGG